MAEGRTQWPPVKDGWFVEPEAATTFLIQEEHFIGGAWDPACGQGNIVEAINRYAPGMAVGTDLRDRTDTMDFFRRRRASGWFLGTSDFMDESVKESLRKNIVSNPPYGRAQLAEAFIRKAVALPGVEKVAMFLNSKFLFGAGRALGLYSELPPDRIYPVFPRPSCPPGQYLLDGGKAEGGVENFVWMIWCVAEPTGRTEFIWAGRGGAGAPDSHSQAPPDAGLGNHRKPRRRRS